MTQNGLDYTTKTIMVSSGIFPQPARQMLCPVCDGEWVHVDGANVIDEWPMGRGHAAVVRFWGECGAEWDLYFGEHKGNMGTYINITKRCREEKEQSYAEYIQSAEWKQKARAAKERAGWRCQVCNASADDVQLDAHHRTYERLGAEIPGDITVLCRDCHQLYHSDKQLRSAKEGADDELRWHEEKVDAIVAKHGEAAVTMRIPLGDGEFMRVVDPRYLVDA